MILFNQLQEKTATNRILNIQALQAANAYDNEPSSSINVHFYKACDLVEQVTNVNSLHV